MQGGFPRAYRYVSTSFITPLIILKFTAETNWLLTRRALDCRKSPEAGDAGVVRLQNIHLLVMFQICTFTALNAILMPSAEGGGYGTYSRTLESGEMLGIMPPQASA